MQKPMENMPPGDSAEDNEWIAQSLRRLELDKSSVERQIISDEVFKTMRDVRDECTLLLATHPWLNNAIVVPVIMQRQDNEQPDQLDEEIPLIAAVSLATTAEMAIKWPQIKDRPDDAKLRIMAKHLDITRDLFETGKLKSIDNIRDPSLSNALQILASDSASQRSSAEEILTGTNDYLINSRSDFAVDVKNDPAENCRALMRGIVDRMAELLSKQRTDVVRSMEQWRKWSQHVETMQLRHLPLIEEVYNDVLIPSRELSGLVSPIASRKERAIEQIEQNGGFLHEFDKKAILDMMGCGTSAVIRDPHNPADILAYYGVITDEAMVRKYLEEWCGLDKNEKYESIKSLPTKSAHGTLKWLNTRFAQQMFAEPDQVAYSVEIAVRKPKTTHVSAEESRRNAGLATALKHHVYSKINRPMILTRHFEIEAVNSTAVPSAINFHSRRLIESLGGRHIGSLDEDPFVHHSLKEASGKQLMLDVVWHYYLEDRKRAIEKIERQQGLK